MNEKENRIRAAGVVQAVITSGAPVEEWVDLAKYGMRVVNYMAAGLNGAKPKAPKVPAVLEKDS